MQNTIRNAASCLSDEAIKPTTVSDYTMVRDVLITTSAISSMKRLQEFGEFRLSEFLERQELKKKDTGESDGYVVRVTRHKTAQKGPSLIYMKEEEEKALTAFVKYYRPLVASCVDPQCYVFPNRRSVEGSCCSQLGFSNLSRLVKCTVRRAAIDAKVTSRILRRSQITAIWDDRTDPAWRQKVATQCCHSLDTVMKYYEF